MIKCSWTSCSMCRREWKYSCIPCTVHSLLYSEAPAKRYENSLVGEEVVHYLPEAMIASPHQSSLRNLNFVNCTAESDSAPRCCQSPREHAVQRVVGGPPGVGSTSTIASSARSLVPKPFTLAEPPEYSDQYTSTGTRRKGTARKGNLP